MGGYPDDLEMTNLEIVATGAASGSDKQDVIEIGPGAAPARNAFDMIASFKAEHASVWWWALAEFFSDAGPAIPANAKFYAESIGPGEEVEIGDAHVDLTAGGDPGGGPADTSLYQVRLNIPNADNVFVDPAGPTLQPGVYRLQCRVDVEAGPNFGTAYYDGDLVVRVSER